MAEQPSSGTEENKAAYGIGGTLREFTQLSSSGEAARKKRDDNQKERVLGALGAAIQQGVSKGAGNGEQDNSEKK
ncbi:uncharacterized protein N7483_008865 [Penicillium malachiteum]|uniref:uncharacterized protein n=1 Tax=Penicillium malachiteum TaxID=1324776 RepID=UPI00254781E3|nr:uncharacterized protein N7483_008865 [Penicillium malachiteum]KAJ5720931.1 hypothetical protein N7483_008865 [Penicillium malachiteum]